MAFAVTTYNDLQVPTYQLSELLELKIVKKISDHAKLFLTGVIPEEQKDKYVHEAQAQTDIVIKYTVDGKEKPLFKGLISNIQVKVVRDIYYLRVDAISYTHLLDVKLNDRSFLYESMSYSDLLTEVTKPYGARFNDTASNGAKLEKFILQYNETDWRFLVRMASQLNVGLVPDVTLDKPAFYFGNPNKSSKANLDKVNYTARKDLANFRWASENTLIENVNEMDFFSIELESVEPLEIGSEVEFNKRSYFVGECVTRMYEGVMKHNCVLVPEDGLRRERIFNDQIIGLSLQGQVTKVEKDQVTVELEIDQNGRKKIENTFQYSTIYTAEGNSGWYCMPEVGDFVRVYFPDEVEHHSFALSSVRMNLDIDEKNNKIGNPDVKYFRTREGKELMFSPEEIVISDKDGEIFLRLNDKNGIEIISSQEVKITAKKGIAMDSQKKIVLAAKEQISLACKGAKIQMDGTTQITGKNVKTN